MNSRQELWNGIKRLPFPLLFVIVMPFYATLLDSYVAAVFMSMAGIAVIGTTYAQGNLNQLGQRIAESRARLAHHTAVQEVLGEMLHKASQQKEER